MTLTANPPAHPDGVPVHIACFISFIQSYVWQHGYAQGDIEQLIDRAMPMIERHLRYEDLPVIAAYLQETGLSPTQDTSEIQHIKESK